MHREPVSTFDMRYHFALALGLSVLALSLLPPVNGELHAGTAVRYDLTGLVDRADLALEGRIVAQRVVLQPDGRIETESTVSVARTFVGDPLAVRSIRLPGGVLPDGRGLVIPGLPGLARGSEVVLFLSQPNANGSRMPVGLAQGCLRAVTSHDGSRYLVRDQSDLLLVDAQGGPVLAAAPNAQFEYDAAIATIESAAAARRAREAAAKAGGR